MSDRIVFQLDGQPVSIMEPCEAQLTTKQVGIKDVPPGVPFWIIDHKDIPSDRQFRDAWDLDFVAMGEPAGYGVAL